LKERKRPIPVWCFSRNQGFYLNAKWRVEVTFGPHNIQNPETIEEAYEGLRFNCARLEELLEASADALDEKAMKRSDKAVTVMKVGFKILKKAIRRRAAKLQAVA
jgi:hypothetical protein